MRKVMLIIAAIAVMVSLFAVAAYAATIDGTDKADTLTEDPLRNDTIKGHGGGDSINAGIEQPAEALQANDGDRDKVYGNKGADLINVEDLDDDDWVSGGKGNDTCVGDPDDNLDCEHEDQQP